jgi:hypothetical protein
MRSAARPSKSGRQQHRGCWSRRVRYSDTRPLVLVAGLLLHSCIIAFAPQHGWFGCDQELR